MVKFLALSLLLVGCGRFPFSDPVTQEAVHSLEGVKLISPVVVHTADPMAFGQSQYLLQDNVHLLLRFESLAEHAEKIATGSKYKIELLIYPDREFDSVPEGLTVCPLSKNWMMLATWFRAHPFGADGVWTKPGGDIHGEGCESPQLDSGTTPEPALVFDLSRWYRDFPEARQQNYGWLLQATNPFGLWGEAHSARSPRVRFHKYVGTR